MLAMRERMEYAAAWIGLKTMGLLPRSAARFVGAAFAAAAYRVRTPLRRAAMFNLRLAFPDWEDAARERAIRGMIRQIGWMAGEFSQFPKYTRATNRKHRHQWRDSSISTARAAAAKASFF